MNWKHIPLAIRVALVLGVLSLGANLAIAIADPHDYKIVQRVYLAMASFNFAARVLFAIGFLDFAHVLVGRARVGALIAFGAALLDIAHTLIWAVIAMKQSWLRSETLRDVMQYLWFASSAVGIVGIAIAAWDKRALAIGGLIVGLVASEPPFMMSRLYSALDLSNRHATGLRVVITLVGMAVVPVLVMAVGRQADQTEPRHAETGFRRAASALWLRVLAVAIVPALTLLAVAGKSQDGVTMIRYAMVFASVISIVSLTQYGIGAIGVSRARLADMHALPLYIAGIAALACAGLAVRQFPQLYQMLFDDSHWGGIDEDMMSLWSIASPLVAMLSLVALAGAIAGFAGRRGFDDVHSEAAGKGMGAGALMLVTLLIAQWLLPTAKSEGSLLFMTMASLTCALIATVMMAKLCSLASESINREPGLPKATVL